MQNQETHFIHRLKYRHRERLVGVLVLVALVLFLAQVLLSTQLSKLFAPTLNFSTELENPIGVNQDTRVRISGLDVGWVDAVVLTPSNRFVINMKIYQEFHNLVRRNSRASISKLAVVGDSIINISPGSIDFQLLANNSEIPSEESMSVDDLVVRLQPVLEQTEQSVIKLASILAAIPDDSIPTIVADVQASLASLRVASEQISSGEGSLGAFMFKDETNQRVQQNLIASEQLIQQGQSTISQVNQSLSALPQLIGKLDVLVAQLSEASDDLPALLEDSNRLVNDSNEVVDGLSESWPLSGLVDPDPDHEQTLPILPAN